MSTKSYTSHASISCFHIITIILLIFVLDLNHQVSSVMLATLKNHRKNNQNQQGGPMIRRNQSSCTLFTGTWIHDESYPLYQSSACPVIDAQFNCQLYGRPDTDYLKYRWKPVNCELPRFNGVDFVTKMRGKTVMFVGDSLGRNQWESLVCMTVSGLPPGTPTQFIRGDPISTFKFLDYGVAISFHKAPYLVDIVGMEGKSVLKLEDISVNSKAWNNVDVLSFNTGHWWTHTGHLQGWDYMEMGGSYYEDMDRLVALERGLRTWATWVDANVDTTRTSVFFQSISPNHYKYPLSLSL